MSTDERNVNSGAGDTAEININLVEVVNSFIKFWWVCVILAVIGAGIMFLKYFVMFEPEYTCDATFTVNTETEETIEGASTYSFYYNKMTAEQLNDTFPYLLSTEMMTNAIESELGHKNEAELTMSSVEDTNMFTIISKHGDAQTAYDSLVAAVKSYPQIAKYIIGNIQLTMLTEPTVPSSPSNTKDYISKTAIGAVIGVVLGLMWIVLYAILRRTIKSETDVRDDLRTEVIGFVPLVTFKKYSEAIDTSILITNSMVTEGYKDEMKVLRNTVTSKLENKKVVMVTGTAPGEGKTTMSTNLALSIAQTGKKVLLIDGDLRNPSVAPLLEMDISKHKDEESFIVRNEENELDVMCFNVPLEKIWSFLQVENLRNIIEPLREKYDLIIVDTPPCGLISDATTISQVCDGVIYVILQDTIKTTRIKNAMEMLLSTDVELFGVILNGITSGVTTGYGYAYGKYGKYGRYGYGHYGRYGHYGYGRYGHYGYGEESEKKSKSKK